jgi:flagellar basal body-associated protein FliL
MSEEPKSKKAKLATAAAGVGAVAGAVAVIVLSPIVLPIGLAVGAVGGGVYLYKKKKDKKKKKEEQKQHMQEFAAQEEKLKTTEEQLVQLKHEDELRRKQLDYGYQHMSKYVEQPPLPASAYGQKNTWEEAAVPIAAAAAVKHASSAKNVWEMPPPPPIPQYNSARTQSSWEDSAPVRRKSVPAALPSVSYYDAPQPVSYVGKNEAYDSIEIRKETKSDKLKR